jgi:uncharacterized membrane protein YgaE (UPF0421/DUF939 family)
MNAKIIGLAVGAGVLGLGMTGTLNRFMPKVKFATKSVAEKLKENVVDADFEQKYVFLDAAAELALNNENQLDDFVERLYLYSKYDEEIWEEFVRAAASTAEFLLRKDEIEKQRSIPLLFKKYSQVMFVRLRELRRIIRDTQPTELEEFDEIVTELTTFQSDMHHNLWCDAHDM